MVCDVVTFTSTQGESNLCFTFAFKLKGNVSVSVCRQQHGLHRGSGPAEPPAAHGQLGRLWLPGGPRRGGGPPLRRAAALLQHALPAVHRSAGGRGGRPQ